VNKVTKIIKKKNDSYQLTMEQNMVETTYIVAENTIVKYRLVEGKEFDEAELTDILQNNEYEILYLKSIHFISYQMRTISEVKKYLSKHTKKESVILKIITELKEKKYLNDLEYVSQFVKEKQNYDLVGPLYIKEKLVKKGIHYDLITNALLNYDIELETEKICSLIDKELKYPFKKNYQKVKLSFKQKFSSKGFHLSAIDSAISIKKERITQNIDEDSLIINDIIKLRRQYNLNEISEKQKVIEKLLQKGYSYWTIKRHIN
jgi:regulatory protein